jgi:sugar porter (SP) family MFS transporter
MCDFFGRRKTLLISAILFATTAVGCMLAKNPSGLIAYRLIGGLGIGIASIASPMYLSEISPPSVRGMVVSLYQMAITIGILTIYISNYLLLNVSLDSGFFFTHRFMNLIFKQEVWRSMFGVGLIPAFLFLLMLLLIPESPRWLVKKGLHGDARSVLLKTRSDKTVEIELKEIMVSLREGENANENLSLVRYKKPVILGVILAFLVQFSGITAVIYYGAKIFTLNDNSIDSAYEGQLLIGVVNVVCTLFAIFFIDRFGRRLLIIAGAILSLICHSAIGLLFFSGSNHSNWLVFFILLYTAAFAATYGPVFWTFISEIYPNNIRGKAMSIAAFANWIAAATVSQILPWMFENLSPSGTFWAFAVFSIPAVYLGMIVIPETKKKSLEELEKYWLKNG